MPRTTHPISVKELDNSRFYFSLTIVASFISSLVIIFTDFLKPLEIFFRDHKIPITIYIPTIGTIYVALFKAWDMGLWKLFQKLGIVNLPVIDGTWFGKVWYEREKKFGYGILIVEQKYIKGFIKGSFESGIHTESQTMSFSAIDSSTPELITNYHTHGIKRGRGTAYLGIETNEQVLYLHGEFFTDIAHTDELRTGYQVYMKISNRKKWNLEGIKRKVLLTDKNKYEDSLSIIDSILNRNIRKEVNQQLP